MKKPDIVKYIKEKHPEMDLKSIKDVVDEIFEVMAEALAKGEKIEIRKIGSFRVLKRKKPL
ncbi:MAG TPA: DNA-binding protein, partial [Sulfurihydrogenibium sp.]|nr:DNA-binding protein [Sulfurihydrogenibium sp.]